MWITFYYLSNNLRWRIRGRRRQKSRKGKNWFGTGTRSKDGEWETAKEDDAAGSYPDVSGSGKREGLWERRSIKCHGRTRCLEWKVTVSYREMLSVWRPRRTTLNQCVCACTRGSVIFPDSKIKTASFTELGQKVVIDVDVNSVRI